MIVSESAIPWHERYAVQNRPAGGDVLMSKIRNVTLKEIEGVLEKIGYFDLEFSHINRGTDTVWFEGHLDTEYRIMVKILDENLMEVWDCDYYVDDYARAAMAKKGEGDEWEVIEG